MKRKLSTLPARVRELRPERGAPALRFGDQRRGTRQQRGYGADWDRRRRQVLDAEPLCRPCQRTGKVALATQVDHIIAKAHGGSDDLANLQPICRACHDAKTAAEGRGGVAGLQNGKF